MSFISNHPVSATTLVAVGLLLAPTTAPAADACASAGLELPAGFCATEYATDAGRPRHLAVAASGTVYVNLANDIDGHGLLALRDSDGDGVADQRQTFGQGGATGLEIHGGWLYAATVTDIYRYRLGDALVPSAEPEHLVSGMPEQSTHSARGLAVSDDGMLFVNNGAPSDACQKSNRTPGSRGQDPCPLLEEHGGIWRFSATATDQRFSPENRFATGLRNMLALDYNSAEKQLYGLQHGRDQLNASWPNLFTEQQSTRLPAEEMFTIDAGDDFGWPYCYYDPERKEKMLNPEYGGDGSQVGRCDRFEQPILAFPAHWAPMDLLFYTGTMFPREYRHGAFIAFHGSRIRTPNQQEGYRVVFLPFAGAKPADDYRDFAADPDFTGAERIRSPSDAARRPAGLAQAPDGALFISDDHGGQIFRVTYDGG